MDLTKIGNMKFIATLDKKQRRYLRKVPSLFCL